MEESLVKEISSCKVSSVLNGDKKTYGKQFLFDGSDETCWNSDKGSSQRIEVAFEEARSISLIKVQFQGGFAAKEVQLQGISGEDDEVTGIVQFFPRDVNQFQEFRLESPIAGTKFRFTLNSSYDFYGRIIIYHLDLWGCKVN